MKTKKSEERTWKRMVRRARGAVQVLLRAPATPPARSCDKVPICDWASFLAPPSTLLEFRPLCAPPPPSTTTPTLASVCIFSLSLSFASLSLSRNSECALEFKKFQPNFSLLYLILFLCCTFQVFCVVRTVLSSWVSSFFSPICASLLNLKGHRELGKRKDPTSFSLFLEWRRFLLGLAGMGMRCLLGFTDPWLFCFCTGSSTF